MITTPVEVAPAAMPRIGTIEERFQSYNVEMVEVTGGEFWRPYAETAAPPKAGSAPRAAGVPRAMSGDPGGLFAPRRPIDLSAPRLRRLAAALGPAYVRVSGTWANTTWFADREPPPASPPASFTGMLTHRQWLGVLEFARAVEAAIVTSFATCAGARDATGVWAPDPARRLLEFTSAAGGRVAAAELMNEPNLAAIGGAPAGYDAAAYGKDFRAFLAFARRTAPELTILGPGSVGEVDGPRGAGYDQAGFLRTRDLLAAAGRRVDAFTYHHYGAISTRGAALGILQTRPEEALSEAWLARTDETLSFYRRLRDEFEPGAPMWLTETADAACGGNPWAATFLDTFRYLDQLGRLARQGVQVVAHNTLAASDYGLLDERTFSPRPSYWAAVLWRKLMGTEVLDPGVPLHRGLHLYAHSLRGVPGGVALLVINNDAAEPRALRIPAACQRYTLSAEGLGATAVLLNGATLGARADGALPSLEAVAERPGIMALAPATITFLAFPRV